MPPGPRLIRKREKRKKKRPKAEFHMMVLFLLHYWIYATHRDIFDPQHLCPNMAIKYRSPSKSSIARILESRKPALRLNTSHEG